MSGIVSCSLRYFTATAIRRRSSGLSLQTLFPSGASLTSGLRAPTSSAPPSHGTPSPSPSLLSVMSTSSRNSSFSADHSDITYLTQEQATNIDVELFGDYGFTIDQLMELAGLAVATAIAKAYPPPSKAPPPKVLICSGPGNNGGDGLVAARHLKWFGYDPCIFYPKQTAKPIFAALRRQCEEMEISFMSFLPDANLVDNNFTLAVDALFGFGFKPPVRPEFVEVLQKMCRFKTPIVSVDVPSGWDVETGPHQDSIKPDMVVSLTAPKKGMQNFHGKHYLGGRYIPDSLAAKFNLKLPRYPGTELVVQLG
ncbi:NAD(P)H-hydrate epimerase [Galendromus occidentalis]|uniref:NAD(P)H-hydrate epimerase n=1 Tax=Galendromus occidentalis TaxID=34638 RepID=A0AAJ7L5A6_9ACAR|nr:NAD(P)H-hydrate epimerase [Galendromus occidentalis]